MPFTPLDAAVGQVRRAEQFVALAKDKRRKRSTRDDLMRQALVMGVAALDAYLHLLITRRLGQVRRGAELPKALRRQLVPFEDLADIADSALESRKQGINARPWVRVKNALQRQLLTQTFQSSQRVADALNMIGIDKTWQRVATHMVGSPRDLQQRLDAIVKRRNQIVHEADLIQQQRPREIKLNGVEILDTANDLDWIRDLVRAIDKELN